MAQPLDTAPAQSYQSSAQHRSTIALFILTVCAVLYVPILSWTQGDLQAVFNYFAMDSYYYLTVAHLSAGQPFYTFDGIYATNGFHPLWQYYLTAAFEHIGALAQQEHQLHFTFWSSVVLSALGSAFFAVVLLRLTRNIALALLATVPGPLYLIHIVIAGSQNSPWSFINGMETPFTVFWFGLTVYLLIGKRVLADPSYLQVASISLLLTLMTLSRLDDIFIFAPFLLFLLFAPTSRRVTGGRLLVAAGIPTVLIGSYLLYNLSYAGMLLPVSGQIKGGLALWPNIRYLIDVFVPRQQFASDGSWSGTAMRSIQLFVPFLIAGAWVIYQIFQQRLLDRERCYNTHYESCMITLLAGYVLLKGLYNIGYVQLLHQGTWYFAASVMTANLIAAVVLARAFHTLFPRPINSMRLAIIAVVLLLPIANSHISMMGQSRFGAEVYTFWQERETIREELLAAYEGQGIVSIDNGIIAYFLEIPTLSGKRFTLDRESYEAGQQGHMFNVAYARDFRVFTSFYYFHVSEEQSTQPDYLQDLFANYVGEDPRPWDFEVVYRNQPTGITFIEARPRDGTAPPTVPLSSGNNP
jgi:hypothetical protein